MIEDRDLIIEFATISTVDTTKKLKTNLHSFLHPVRNIGVVQLMNAMHVSAKIDRCYPQQT